MNDYFEHHFFTYIEQPRTQNVKKKPSPYYIFISFIIHWMNRTRKERFYSGSFFSRSFDHDLLVHNVDANVK
jgi:hypothetical protein